MSKKVVKKLSKSDKKVPECVSLHRNVSQLNKMLKYSDNLNESEITLKNWFKCTKFDENCFKTCPEIQTFKQHMNDMHENRQNFCIYCHRFEDEVKLYFQSLNTTVLSNSNS